MSTRRKGKGTSNPTKSKKKKKGGANKNAGTGKDASGNDSLYTCKVTMPKGTGKKDKSKITFSFKTVQSNTDWVSKITAGDAFKAISKLHKKYKNELSDLKKPAKPDDLKGIDKYLTGLFKISSVNPKMSGYMLAQNLFLTDAPASARPEIKGKKKPAGPSEEDSGNQTDADEKKDSEEKTDVPAPTGSSPNPANDYEIASIRQEYEERIQRLKEALATEKKSKAMLEEQLEAEQQQKSDLQDEYDQLKEKYEPEADDLGNAFGSKIDGGDGSSDEGEAKIRRAHDEKMRDKARISELEEQLHNKASELSTVSAKLSRAEELAQKYAEVAAKMEQSEDAREFASLTNDLQESLEEIEELAKINKANQDDIKALTEEIKKRDEEIASMKPEIDSGKKAQEQLEAQEKEVSDLRKSSEKAEKERASAVEKYEKIAEQIKEMVSKESLERLQKRYDDYRKDVKKSEEEAQKRFGEKVSELEKCQAKVTELNLLNAKLTEDNGRLMAGGGSDVNLGINLDLELGFSLFKSDEFDFPPNVSRDELKRWALHVKQLFSEMNNELCGEINSLSSRVDLLEAYIEYKKIPFPEDDGFSLKGNHGSGGDMNSDDPDDMIVVLPHPVPSMTIEEIELLNPSKQQLKDFLDLVLTEWRKDENNMMDAMLDGAMSREICDELLGISKKGDRRSSVKREKDDEEEKNRRRRRRFWRWEKDR